MGGLRRNHPYLLGPGEEVVQTMLRRALGDSLERFLCEK
jgi:hypothetical protein